MKPVLSLQIILLKPLPDIDFGIQKGSGHTYETFQKQRSGPGDLVFRFAIQMKGDKHKGPAPGFSGNFVQGPRDGKFVYIDIGILAGQQDGVWERRLKIPLYTITWKQIDKIHAWPGSFLEARVPGTGKDGGPNCGTVKPFEGWHFKNK
jgi:hypothetical protein